jgi:hypothetical protein
MKPHFFRQNSVLIILISIIGVTLWLWSPFSKKKPPTSQSEESEEIVGDPSSGDPVSSETPEPMAAATTMGKPVSLQAEGPSEKVRLNYAQKLRDLGTCLETRNSVPGDELEPSLQVLIDSVRGEWGESVINTEDWMQVEMQTPEGERRRLRVEMDFDNETQVQRKLKFMSVAQDGQTATIPISEDQAIEPSESLIASLESGNKILVREKFERIYFQNGEEIVARQKDGFISELEVNKGPKTFKCLKLNEEESDCKCVQ